MTTATATLPSSPNTGHERPRSVEPKGGGRFFQFINPPALILVLALGLALLGVTILFSASASIKLDPYYFVRRQLLWITIALFVGFLAARVNLEKLRRFTWVIAIAIVLGLIAVRIPGIGVYRNGSWRWLQLGPMLFQVSEFAKLGMVFALAHYVAKNAKDIPHWFRGCVLPLGAVGLVCGIIVIEPDFGTASLIGAVAAAMLLLAQVRLIHLVPTVVTGATAIAVAIMHNPERVDRLLVFVDPKGHKSTGGYQLWQAILGFGNGGMEGVGLGNGRQQLQFLPEAHTDFIFAVVGEELGLAFTLAVVVAFTLIFIAGVMHARRAPNLFQYLLVSGSLLVMIGQAIINLGVVMGLLPTKGMSLPFISYGGSNLLLMAIVVGLMINTQTSWSRPVLKDRDRGMKEFAA